MSSDVGGHEIIIRGQIPDYVSNIGITFDLPSEISGRILRGGYTVFFEESGNVERALINCGKENVATLNRSIHSAPFIFDL